MMLQLHNSGDCIFSWSVYGRASRRTYILGVLAIALLWVAVMPLLRFAIFNEFDISILCGIPSLLGDVYNVEIANGIEFVGRMLFVVAESMLWWFLISLGVRRLHDVGLTGWFVCIYFVPYLGPIVMLIALFCSSSPNNNKWGIPANIK